MTKTLYVGNLPLSMKENELEKLFSSYGRILSTNVVENPMDNGSKGYGFVKFEKELDADNAITDLNGTEQRGNVIEVKETNTK